MTILKDTRRAQLDRTLGMLPALPAPPKRGWVRAIREGLGMSLRQLSERMGHTSASAAADLEGAEQSGGLSIKRLRAAADALECDLVYVLVPRNGTLNATLDARALTLAEQQVWAVDRHMLLEDQGTSKSAQRLQIESLAKRLRNGSLRKLWDRV